MAAPLLRHSASHTAPPPAATALRANRWQHACSPVNLTYNTARREAPVPVAAAAGEAQPSAGSSLAEAAATPLLDAVLERGGRASDVPFHVPGHKRGTSTPPWLSHMLGGALRYDLTELDGLDVLSTPSGPIAAAQHAAAATWGADATWFLVNGTTGGIHAAVMATRGPGDALIVARNAHLSAFNAMVLAGCTPVWAQPSMDPGLGVAHALTPAALEAAFWQAAARGLRVGAALVVSPTYFGVVSDVAGLAAVCHAHGVPLLVDEAHGAHLGLHPELPPSALQAGADLAVQSTHKQLSALTQAAMLHVRGGRVAHQRVSRALQVLQSSSPSYLLMASLDAARGQAAQPAAHEASLAAAALARRRLAALPGVRLLSVEQAAACSTAGSGSDILAPGGANSSSVGGIALDPLRLTLDLRRLGLSGYQAAAELEQQYGIVPELCTPTCVVLALSIGSTPEHADALVAAVQRLSQRHGNSSSTDNSSRSTSSRSVSLDGSPAAGTMAAVEVPETRLTPRDAFFAASEAVQAENAIGRVSAELLCPYPPGVPVAYPGEVLTEGAVRQLRQVLRSGGTVTGCSDGSLETLRVVVE
ncbi:hypothetical protein ABPG77_004000 [Micractinium sp. CCAP 211/92]